MSVSNFVCLAALVLAFGSCKKEIAGESGETGTLEAKIVFGQAGTRATNRPVPVTSWKNIKQIQMFLYDQTTGVVKFSDMISAPQVAGTIQKTWSMVPAGTYTLAVVANTKSSSDRVSTLIGGTALEWTGMNVRSRLVTDLHIQHKPLPTGFPAAILAGFPNGALPAGLAPFEEPSEVFMAYATSVSIASGATTTLANPLELQREVALMRIRVRINDQSQNANNSNLDFTDPQTSLMIYTLPEEMNISEGNAGGVTTTSIDKAVLVAADGNGTFIKGDPSSSSHAPTNITDTNFELWREVVVFPNNGGRVNNGTSVNAPVSQRYYVVITAHAPKDHRLSDGSLVADANGALIHWGGLVEASFEANKIRELNLNLSSGGTIGVPSEPAKEGGLKIEIKDPLPWDSNVEITDIDL
jgi:hypothetical protein